jgi:hypothetical protein
MKYVLTLVATLIILSMLVIPSPAYAATVEECQAQIDALRVQTQETTFLGQNATKDQAGLLAKLDTGSTKLAAGKNADAIQKLTDFQVRVTQLEEQGKVSDADAVTLISGADQAIACIQSLTSN